ncbi:hypothetical protein [Paenibacillus sp. Cedars]|uniref:hypothetical protein n=1 Tax=Paenibacillus sp. Cedars TaxID=1980674 RepID=UPI0011637FA9|nr:hypothetical protein [Paenibacillus sp. Cedars]AWP28424.1 hypothetical protein B9D94_18160 [Paenibacillus sp. Cedars]
MNELSRMERHRSRNKGRKNKTPAASEQGTASKSQRAEDTLNRSKSSVHKEPVEQKLQDDSPTEGLSRSRSTRSRSGQSGEEVPAPKRTNTYSSYRVRMSKWFVNSLIVIFILLMVGLLWWGLIGAPPLSELLKELL